MRSGSGLEHEDQHRGKDRGAGSSRLAALRLPINLNFPL